MTARPALIGPEEVAETAYSLSLLAEYTHALDTLPIDLSRNFADLRELDAVLSSSMQTIGSRIKKLTEMIQQGQGTKEERLWMLTEIAEDANRLKLGGEDKIRVACQAADNLRLHSNHLRDMASVMPGFNPEVLIRNTVYPHVAAISHPPANIHEHGRRRKVATQGSCLPMGAPDPSPHKRKRVPKDDDDRNYRKEKVNDGRGRNGRKKPERAPSPAESQISITSYSHPPGHSSSRAGPSSKRFKNNGHVNGHSAVPYDQYPPYDPIHANGSRRGPATPDIMNLPPATHHPSIPLPYQNGSAYHYDPPTINGDWDHPGQGLEGPGMPMNRNGSVPASHTSLPVPPPDDNDGDPDGEMDDGKTYCFCERVSYGQMIACDDQKCEREWFHLECIGLSAPPEGRWYCDACKQKKNSKAKTARGGKRKGNNGRGANGRTTAALA